MKVTSESKENLVPATSKESLNDNGTDKPYDALNDSDEYVLTPVEKKFLLTAERGDCAGLRRLGHIAALTLFDEQNFFSCAFLELSKKTKINQKNWT